MNKAFLWLKLISLWVALIILGLFGGLFRILAWPFNKIGDFLIGKADKIAIELDL